MPTFYVIIKWGVCMFYELVKSTSKDIDRLIEYKKSTVFEYADNLSDDEINKINKYVSNEVLELLDNYYNIVVDGKNVGCLLLTDEKDGKLLDEIYLLEDYRNKGIGTSIITRVLDNNDIVYLWVYKKNVRAFSLYKRLGFSIVNETDTRYYMKYCK